jgi:hypothetical protein
LAQDRAAELIFSVDFFILLWYNKNSKILTNKLYLTAFIYMYIMLLPEEFIHNYILEIMAKKNLYLKKPSG